ncbi:MAG: DNRLRE domain-containing protein [Candidatus Sumerlaeia bacterium]|nr:DNRLRE domain-containing protein [Candidatus Sumerlaeia bacterium]
MIGLLSAAGPSPAAAAPLVLREGLDGYAGTADASVFEGAAYENNSAGALIYLIVGRTNQNFTRRGLVRFDLSALPSDAVVTDATLRLVVDRSGMSEAQDFTLHRATRAWGEGSVNPVSDPGQGAPAAAGDATWLSAAHQQQAWTTPGGDYVATASATANGAGPGTETVFSGAGLLADIEAWRADPAANHGWVVRGDEAQRRSAKRFYTSEAASDATDRPTLTLQLAEPAPSGWTLY